MGRPTRLEAWRWPAFGEEAGFSGKKGRFPTFAQPSPGWCVWEGEGDHGPPRSLCLGQACAGDGPGQGCRREQGPAPLHAQSPRLPLFLSPQKGLGNPDVGVLRAKEPVRGGGPHLPATGYLLSEQRGVPAPNLGVVCSRKDEQGLSVHQGERERPPGRPRERSHPAGAGPHSGGSRVWARTSRSPASHGALAPPLRRGEGLAWERRSGVVHPCTLQMF